MTLQIVCIELVTQLFINALTHNARFQRLDLHVTELLLAPKVSYFLFINVTLILCPLNSNINCF